jgi:hypothetical protein
MASIPNNFNESFGINVSTIPDYIIKGEMITASHVIDINKISQFSGSTLNNVEYEIKKQLTASLVEEMFKSKYILFTKVQDVTTYQDKYMARVFVTPSEQVQIIRDLSRFKF